MADLTTKLGKLILKNPVMTASGTYGYGEEYSEFYPLDTLGAIMVKGISPEPVNGNPMPRVCETSSGMLNAIGLQNPGVEKFISNEKYMPFLRKHNATVIVNIWGKSIDDYRYVAERLDDVEGIHALEINISCPNIKEGGIAFGTDLKVAAKVVSEVRKASNLPLITKLSPNVTKIADFAKVVVNEGSDIVSLINTLTGMAIDIETRKPKLANVTGGLSGAAIKPVAIKMVYDVANAVDVPVIGMGGIFNSDDAVEFFLAGADAIAVGTANFVNPVAPVEIISGINKYLDDNQFKNVNDIVGKVII
ncbi:MAG TPA: dihydroorotate dehydrogenase [Victivallales bacterium]|nr:dihydroorotate dehydrogenase [Victivallales bacterium]